MHLTAREGESIREGRRVCAWLRAFIRTPSCASVHPSQTTDTYTRIHTCVYYVCTHTHTHTHTHTNTHTQVRDLKGAVEQNGKVGELDSGRRYANALPAVMAAATLQLSQLVSLVAGFEV